MKIRIASGCAWILFSVACGAGDAAEPRVPPTATSFGVPPEPLYVSARTPVGDTAAFSPPRVRGVEGSVALTSFFPVMGQLEGQLRNIDLSGATTANTGVIERWDGGGSNLNLNIATTGSPSGAAMLIVSVIATEITQALDDGYWSSAAPDDDPASQVFVSSCAGPVIGDWPWEIQPVEVEMTASEDAEQPDTVVLVVKGHFPSSETDYDGLGPTSELTGTLRFERAALELTEPAATAPAR